MTAAEKKLGEKSTLIHSFGLMFDLWSLDHIIRVTAVHHTDNKDEPKTVDHWENNTWKMYAICAIDFPLTERAENNPNWDKRDGERAACGLVYRYLISFTLAAWHFSFWKIGPVAPVLLLLLLRKSNRIFHYTILIRLAVQMTFHFHVSLRCCSTVYIVQWPAKFEFIQRKIRIPNYTPFGRTHFHSSGLFFCLCHSIIYIYILMADVSLIAV